MAVASSSEPLPGPSGCVEIPTVLSDRSVNVEICWKVALGIGKQWKWLGRSMGLADVKLENIEERYRNDREEMAYQMLLVWKETRSQQATISVLFQHLKEVGRADLASKVLKMAEESATIPQVRQISQTEQRSSQTAGSQAQSFPAPLISQEDVNRAWVSLKAKLQTEHKRQQIPKIPWLKDWEMNFDEYYVDLSIKYNDSTNATDLYLHEIFKPSQENLFRRIYHTIFTSRELTFPTRILIEGPAGYGKSTLARKLCFDHAKGKNYIRHFEAVVLIRLREFSGTLEEMITNTIQLNDYSTRQVFEAIKQNQKQILIILDGFDELPQDSTKHLIPLVKGNQLPQATVIVTSRLGYYELKTEDADSSITNLLHCVDSRILIKGLQGKNRVRFLQLYLKGYPSEKLASVGRLVHKRFGLYKEKNSNLFDCPLFLLLLVVVSEEAEISSLETKTQLYKHLFNFMLQRTLVKEGNTDKIYDFFNFSEKKLPSYINLLSQFGSLAGEALRTGQYSFTEEEVLRICDNDKFILKLGILTQNDCKLGRKRKLWYEPIHLSFLEFSFAYHIWISLKLGTFFTFILQEKHVVALLKEQTLVLPFLCGLFGEQFCRLVFDLPHNDFYWLEAIAGSCDYGELLADTNLKPRELADALLPLVPTDYVRPSWKTASLMPVLVKETLMRAMQVRRNQCISLNQHLFVGFDSQSIRSLPLKIVPKWETEVSHDWCELTTTQNLIIYNRNYELVIFQITLRNAHLDEQLKWLSNWIIIEGLLIDKSVHQICYMCTTSQLEETFNGITDLIHQENVESVSVVSNFMEFLPLKLWTNFIHCANQSQQLLDLGLHFRAKSPLCVHLDGKEGKVWRRIELEGDVIPYAGSLPDPPTDILVLESFIREMSSRIHTLRINSRVFNCNLSYAFFQNDDAPIASNLRELRIRWSNDSKYLLNSCIWRFFEKFQVLAIELSTDFKIEDQDVITFILSVLSQRHLLTRLELWDGCTEDFITTFFQRLSKASTPTTKTPGQGVHTNLHLDTVMLSPLVSSRNEIPDSTTFNSAKELLLSGNLQHLWICCADKNEGYAKREFMELFSPADGFTCKRERVSYNENDLLWDFNYNTSLVARWRMSESSCVNVMNVFKITAHDRNLRTHGREEMENPPPQLIEAQLP